MAQHTYDEESVQELLGWAKKMLETKNYPTEKYQVNACTSIIDGKLYLESLISMISKNWENPTFHPTIQLWNIEKSGKVKRSNVSFNLLRKCIMHSEAMCPECIMHFY